MRRVLTAATTALILTFTGASAGAAQPAPGIGSDGVGDVYYPAYGNGGYDVSHYDVRLRYDPATDHLSGTTTVLATATENLTRFNLDFALDVEAVTVNGATAEFARESDHELVVTPARQVVNGTPLNVAVRYSGVPSEVSVHGFTAWSRTSDGAMAVGEPEMAWWWFPSNDHPTDKATYDISVLVPDGVEVISNGVRPAPPRAERVGWTRWFWRMNTPMSTYLAFLAIGQYEIVEDTAPNGQPVLNAYSETLGDLAPAAKASLERTAEVVAWEESLLGEYPYPVQGGVAGAIDGIGFALETAGRPVYGPGFFRRGSNMYVVVHELAHQWFGDSVSVSQWKDIWLHEGFASYLEWLWSETHGEGSAQEVFDFWYANYPADSAFWQVLPGDPSPETLFHTAVYDRGAMTLHQLRLAVGDDDFFEILRTWVAEHKHGNATIDQFILLSEEISGESLEELFDTWLYTAGRPEVASPAGDAASSAGGATALKAPAKPRSIDKMRDAAVLRELHEHAHD